LGAGDISAIEKAVNDAAGKTGALWLTFISITAFLLITTGSVTHRNLLLQTPLQLPLLDVDLPLVSFFVVAPVFFIIIHFNLFLQMDALASKIQTYNSVLRSDVADKKERHLLRHRLDGFLLVQVLAGPSPRRDRRPRFMLELMGWITSVALPLALLVYIAFTFLPYHYQAVTWFHRAMVVLDVVIICAFWHRIHGARPARLIWGLPRTTVGAGMVLVLFIVAVPTFPGEAIYSVLRNPLTGLLFEGSVDQVTGEPSSPFSNRLIVMDQDLSKASLSFRGRDLRGAILDRSKLTKADFTGAKLTDARLIGASLSNARFGCADKDRRIDCTDLRGANLAQADLRAADFAGARMQGVSLERAKLRMANFAVAELFGASLRYADLEDADFTDAYLQGASLTRATISVRDAPAPSTQFGGAHVTGAGLIGLQIKDGASPKASSTGALQDPSERLLDTTGRPWTGKDERQEVVREQQNKLRMFLEALACGLGENSSVPKDPDPDDFDVREAWFKERAGDRAYIARGLARNQMFAYTGDQITVLADRLLLGKPRSCTGAVGLTEADRADLRQWVQVNTSKD
jgi:uncharacterized protein YjbI with pentapeptide repeats